MTQTTRTVALLVAMVWSPTAAAQTYSAAEAMREAVTNAPARIAAKSMHEASRAATRVEAAGLWPQLVANGVGRYNQPIAEIDLPILPQPIELGTAWNASVGLTAQWRVLDVARWASVDAAAARELSSLADAHNASLEVERGVRDLYLSAVYMGEVVEATKISRSAMVRSLEDLTAQLDVGLASEVDVATARARVAEVEARLVDANTHRSSALASLRVMIGLDQNAPLELSQSVTDIATMEAPGAAAVHPQVQSVRRAAEASDRDVIAAARRWWPTIDVFATGEYRYPGTLVDDTAGFGWVAGAQISWLLFDGGLRFAATDAQRAKARALRSNADALQQRLDIQRADASGRIASADASLQATQARLDATEQLAALTRVSLEAGTGRVTEVLDADVAVDQARLAQVTAMYQLALAKSALWRANATEFSSREPKP